MTMMMVIVVPFGKLWVEPDERNTGRRDAEDAAVELRRLLQRSIKHEQMNHSHGNSEHSIG